MLNHLNAQFNVEEDLLKNGIFVHFRSEEKQSIFHAVLGKVDNFERFLCSYRTHAYFNAAKSGEKISEIPRETQWIAFKHSDEDYSVIFPLADEPFRTSIVGNENNEIELVMETGDPSTVENQTTALYIARGGDFYALLEGAGKSIAQRFKTCRTREDKPTPDFINYFGWCTWDSFYEKVSQEDVVKGLESFQNGGILPKLLILDDGWQTVNPNFDNRGLHKLSGLSPNEKFGNDLTGLTHTAKSQFDVKYFFVWHALMGYWGGMDTSSPEMKKYHVKDKFITYSDNVKQGNQRAHEFVCGVPSSDKLFDFYNDYHKKLMCQGVDGVKVDVQTECETFGCGEGGRVRMARKYHEALEASVHLNFSGELINCMSCSNDIIYHTKASNVMRTSDDFLPNRPESHKKHIYNNAVNSLWIGQFVYCDWDMFQTKHPMGAYHAAARAIYGGPVYVSDKVDEHDFGLIGKLTLADGTIPLALNIAKPTMASLFANPFEKQVPYAIFNMNPLGGVIGCFNMHEGTVSGQLKPSDIPSFQSGRYIVYSHNIKTASILHADEGLEYQLEANGFEIFTVAKIENEVAVIGLTNKFNSGATVQLQKFTQDEAVLIPKDDGTLLFYSERTAQISYPKYLTLSVDKNKCFYYIRVKKHAEVIITFCSK